MKRDSVAAFGLARGALCVMQLALSGWGSERGWMMKLAWIVWALVSAMPWSAHAVAPMPADDLIKCIGGHRLDHDVRIGACTPRYCIVKIALESGEPAKLHVVELNERGRFARLHPVTVYGETMREARFVGRNPVRLYVRSADANGALAHQLFDLSAEGFRHAMASRVLRGNQAIREDGDQVALERAIEGGRAPRLLV